MHISITNEIVHKVPFPTLHTLPRWHSQSVEGYITNYKWKHSICALAAWRKAFGCSFALNVRSSATEPGRLKKAMVWVICNLDPLWWFFLPPLLSPSFAAGDPDTSHWTRGMTPQWNGHWQAEGRSCGTRKGQCYCTDGNWEPHTLSWIL